MEIIKKYISELLKWDGYIEKQSNSQLDDKTANAGNKNYNRFARDYFKHTGINFQAQPWCMIYLNSVLVEVVGLINAKKALYGNLYASCRIMANTFKANKAFYATPQIGDFPIFTNSKGNIAHVGAVLEIKNGRIYTIEGNTSSMAGVVDNGGMVRQKSYPISYKQIYGYCRPNYKAIEIKEILNGWIEAGGKWQYWSDNVQQKSVWVESADKKSWYFIKENGWMAEKEWVADSNKWYYLKEDGKMASNELLIIDNDIFGKELYYFAKDGHMCSTNDRGALI